MEDMFWVLVGFGFVFFFFGGGVGFFTLRRIYLKQKQLRCFVCTEMGILENKILSLKSFQMPSLEEKRYL